MRMRNDVQNGSIDQHDKHRLQPPRHARDRVGDRIPDDEQQSVENAAISTLFT